MALQFSTTLRNNQLAQIESTIGTSPLLRIYTGAAPANTAAAASGTLLVEMALPSDWLAAPSSGSVAKAGTWEDTSANGTGTAGHYRIYDNAGTTCHIQGTVTATGGGGDIELANTNIASGQGPITITSYSISAANA